MRFDEFGRLWVAEMADYPHGPQDGAPGRSRIKLLEDPDRDGQFDHAQLFADDLLFVTGLQPWLGGVIVTMAGEVAYLKDTTGDGRADLRETWFRGFAEENSQLRANHPRLGLDNQIYVANGLRGGSVFNPRTAGSPVLSLSGKDFRFDPRSFDYDVVTGAGQFGNTFDDFGNRFTCTNRNPLIHVVHEERYLRQNPGYASSTVVHDVAAAGGSSRLYPLSRAWTTSHLHANQFTAACGVLIYRGNRLPSSYYTNAFTCDPTGNLVHREIVRPVGATFQSRPAREGVEFLATRDEWFRPVNLAHGPDGCLYVVDMYRAVIEHPEFMPDELKRRPDLLLGNDRGRIYRVRADRIDAAEVTELMGNASDRQLVAYLKHSNAWQRETASRLLLERAATTAAQDLVDLTRRAPQGSTRLRALWALQGLSQLDETVLLAALQDTDPRVRAGAIVLCEGRLAESVRLKDSVLALAQDEDLRVCFQVALSLAPVSESREVGELARMALRSDTDYWLRSAIAISAANRPLDMLAAVLSARARPPIGPEARQLVADLVAMSADQGDASQALRLLVELTDGEDAVRRIGLLSLARRQVISELPAAADVAIAEALRATWARAVRLAADADQPAASRAQAVELLGRGDGFDELLLRIALHESQLQVRRAAIAALARRGDPSSWPRVLAAYPSAPPAVRREVATASLSGERATRLLLDAIERGTIRANELDRSAVSRLIRHRDPALRQRATAFLTDAVPADRQRVLQHYRQILSWRGDPRKGQQVFVAHCASCHRIGTIGVNVAPDISDSRTKQPQQLLTDILQPNRAVDGNYVSYSVLTADGLSYAGVISGDTATSLTLRQPGGKEVTLLRRDIEETLSLGISLMPDGLEQSIPLREMADLIAFLKNWRYLDGRTPLGKTSE